MHSSPHRVSDVMTGAVVAVGREALFKDIVERMEQWKVSALPVLEGDGRVIGVVSEADLLPKEEFRDSNPDRFTQLRRLPDLAKAGAMNAEELMSTPAVTVHADATLAEAARIMALRRVKRLPVVNAEGLLEGVVSRGDLLKVFLRRDNDLANEIRRDVVDLLFPAPVEPVHITVTEGVATLTGRVPDATRIPLAVRLVRGVEGVVGVDCRLTAANE
ncbi:CBS domain-containing protein [Streptomyces sp. NBC_01549]|uniref:CBS domain-containing protein n=1 Tax=Streptomyces sp. NBC_01549 TaxID=2975874 RepID=UPI00224E67CE|nr:CBS domain-containing protein [Streptomyces sp. NBC_01549]MCX4595871.1 CBS domain-containing protein [Streptomyces sp. NBC_01549]